MNENDTAALYLPRLCFHSVLDVTPEDIKALGAKAVALDIDNTICPDGKFICIRGVKKWLKTFADAGIPVMTVSNCTLPRMLPFFLFLRLPFVHLARKPKTKALLKAARKMNVDISELAMIGDGIFKDVLAANKCGAIPVRIDPLPAKTTLYPRYYAKKQREEEEYIKLHEKEFETIPYK